VCVYIYNESMRIIYIYIYIYCILVFGTVHEYNIVSCRLMSVRESLRDTIVWRGFREWRFFNGGELLRAVRPPPPPTELFVHGTAHRSWNNASSDIWFFFLNRPGARQPVVVDTTDYHLPFEFRIRYFDIRWNSIYCNVQRIPVDR